MASDEWKIEKKGTTIILTPIGETTSVPWDLIIKLFFEKNDDSTK